MVKFLSQAPYAKDEQLTSIEGADMGEHIHPEKYRLKYIHIVLVFNIHSKSEKVCGTAFSFRKKNCGKIA